MEIKATVKYRPSMSKIWPWMYEGFVNDTYVYSGFERSREKARKEFVNKAQQIVNEFSEIESIQIEPNTKKQWWKLWN